MQYFETRFLDEAEKFVAGLDPKTIKKLFYNIDLAEQTNDPRLFKKLQKKFGNLGLGMAGFKYGYLPSGIKPVQQKHLLLLHMGSLKK